MKKIIITGLLMISSIMAFALDATRMPQSYNYTPSIDTRAYRAEQNAATALDTANSVSGIANAAMTTATSADGIAKGTRATLVNKNGCVYNANFDCTEENLTYEYRTTNHSKSWVTPGNYTWRVPTGVTSITVIFAGGGGSFGSLRRSGSHGGATTFAGTTAAGGRAGYTIYDEQGDYTTGDVRGQAISRIISVIYGLQFSMSVGHGGAAVRRGLGSGTNGSVVITYVKNVRLITP